MSKAPGQESFEAYNNAGANPGRTWDGKNVPTWDNLSDDVRAKWAAAEKAAGRARLNAFGNDRGHIQVDAALRSAHDRYARECIAHNGPLPLRVLLECFEDELQKCDAQRVG